MPTTNPPEAAATASARFAAMLAPTREPRRVVEDAEFLAMLHRMVRALEARTIERPENLTQVVALVQRLAEVPNVAIAVNADRFDGSSYAGASMAECGRAMGITKQSASDRRAVGQRIIAERLDQAGAVDIADPTRAFRKAEATRERAAITRAADYAVVNMADYRARHRAA